MMSIKDYLIALMTILSILDLSNCMKSSNVPPQIEGGSLPIGHDLASSSTTRVESHPHDSGAEAELVQESTQLPSIQTNDVDRQLLHFLGLNLPLAQFINQATLYGRSKDVGYENRDLINLYQVYKTVGEFEIPCNLDSALSLSHVSERVYSMKHEDLRKVMQFLLRDGLIERYSHKCIDEFDEAALSYFGTDPELMLFMDRVTCNILPTTRPTMVFTLIKNDLNPKTKPLLTNMIKQTSYNPEICNYIHKNQHIQKITKILYQILGPTSDLRTQSVVDRLNQQMSSNSEANTIKLLSCTLFCRCIHQNRAEKYALRQQSLDFNQD